MGKSVKRNWNTVLGRPSLESTVVAMYESGYSEEEIAKQMHTSLKYVHSVLSINGLVN